MWVFEVRGGPCVGGGGRGRESEELMAVKDRMMRSILLACKPMKDAERELVRRANSMEVVILRAWTKVVADVNVIHASLGEDPEAQSEVRAVSREWVVEAELVRELHLVVAHAPSVAEEALEAVSLCLDTFALTLLVVGSGGMSKPFLRSKKALMVVVMTLDGEGAVIWSHDSSE